MSLFGANSAQPVQGIPTTPPTTRSNPDRKRREKRDKKGNEQSHREEDRADLSHHAETPPPAEPPKTLPRDPEQRPHIDVQG